MSGHVEGMKMDNPGTGAQRGLGDYKDRNQLTQIPYDKTNNH